MIDTRTLSTAYASQNTLQSACRLYSKHADAGYQVLAGWDWIRRNLMRPNLSVVSSVDESKPPPKIGVCGEVIGGSLAAMLALTECRQVGGDSAENNKGRISAAAIGNPLADWTALFPEGEDTMLLDRLESRQSSVKPLQITQRDEEFLSIPSLLDLRQQYFRKPEHFFDPFASPSLFFRTPSFDLPYSQSPITRSDGKSEDASSSVETPAIMRKKRFYHRTYPPLHSRLLLPHVKVTVGKDNVLRDQGLDFIERVRASAQREEEGPSSPNPTNAAADRFACEQKDGLGLWGERDVKDIAAWFGDVLRRP